MSFRQSAGSSHTQHRPLIFNNPVKSYAPLNIELSNEDRTSFSMVSHPPAPPVTENTNSPAQNIRTPNRKHAFLSRKRLSPISLLTPSPPPARTQSVTPPPPLPPLLLPARKLTSFQQDSLDDLHDFDLPTPVKTAEITLKFRELGKLTFSAGTKHAVVVAAVGQKAREVLGAGAGVVKGFRDVSGEVDEARWMATQAGRGEWTVSLEWEW